MSDSHTYGSQLLAVDCHVHLYNWLNLIHMLDNALASFSLAVEQRVGRVPFFGALVLTEPRQRDTFDRLRRQVKIETPWPLNANWSLYGTTENPALAAIHREGIILYLISGQQVITRENLEVLSIGTVQNVPDQQTLQETLTAIRTRDGFPVLPWGAGKWLFGRGKLITQTLTEKHEKDPLAIADNGGRPTFWKAIPQFEQAQRNDIPLLRGTDPLEVSEIRRAAGSFGTLLRCEFDSEYPCRSLLTALQDNTLERYHFGSLEQPARFFKDQIALRFH